ncbi:DNA polymerase Y family protein [soil metagenome]
MLALETFRPRWSEPIGELPIPHVVIDRERVLVINQAAAVSGVRIGMRRGGVAAISPGISMHERDAAREQAAWDSVALTLLQYTPEVALAQEDSLLLDVSASLRAFGGLLRLCRLVRASVLTLGFTPQLGVAPTAQGAWLLARYRPGRSRARQRRVLRMPQLIMRLDALPCSLLPAARPYHDWLHGIGCRTLGAMRKLPRAGLLRRCDKDMLQALDCAYGEAPELFVWVEAPQSFSVRLELPDRIDYAEALLFAARRLIVQMIGWLVALQLAVSHFVLSLEHERGRVAIAPTPLEIMLAEPAWHEEHLIRLLKERLGRLELCAPVIAIRLDAARVSAMLPPNESLFPEPGGTAADFHRLLELLTARLGNDSVLAPAPQADHRPEICNAWLPVATTRFSLAADQAAIERPFWLLEKPIALTMRNNRPFYGSPLKLICGPERIEAGWWDGALVARDYFIAQGSEAACYWVYRERAKQEAGWFLQGLFA